MGLNGTSEGLQYFSSLGLPFIIDPSDSDFYDAQVDSFQGLNEYLDLDTVDGASSFLYNDGHQDWSVQGETFAGIDFQGGAAAGFQWCRPGDERAAWSDLETVRRLQGMHIPPPQVFDSHMSDQTLELFGTGSWTEDGSVRPAEGTTMLRQSETNKHTCRECPESFPTAHRLEEHAKFAKHPCYVCTVNGCEKRYCRRDVYFRHLANHKESGLHVCPECTERKAFTRKDHFNQHLRNRHPDSPFRHDPLEACTMSRQVSTLGDDRSGTSSAKTQQAESSRSDTELSKSADAMPSGHCCHTARNPNGQSKTVREIASALSSILGENHIAIQMIEQSPDTCGLYRPEQFALSLAELALVEPTKLPPLAKEKLETSASRSPKVNMYTNAGCE